MPYDPANPNVLREILRRLSGEQFLSSQKIIDLVLDARKSTAGVAPFSLTRNSLDRFKSGQRIRNVQGLREVWHTLESHSHYSYAFQSPDALRTSTVDVTLASVLPLFFSKSVNQPYHDLSAMGDRTIGRYMMYRPHWRPRVPVGLARNSLVCIEPAHPGFKISETQDFPATEEEGAFVQHDTGAMVSFGKYIYFLMREETGTAVKFGLIDVLFPNSGTSRVGWFRGIVFTSSNLSIFPLAKFFCRRIDGQGAVTSKVLEIDSIPDADARAYLMSPLSLPL